MTHEELLSKIEEYDNSCNTAGSDKAVPKSSGWDCYELHSMAKSLRAVVKLHRPVHNATDTDYSWWGCLLCEEVYPCWTVKLIERELQ